MCGEHPADFPGVSSVATTERNYPQSELPGPAVGGYPAAQVLGYMGTINAAELKSRATQGYQAGDAYGQSGLEYQYESELRGTPGPRTWRSTPPGRWRRPQDHPGHPGGQPGHQPRHQPPAGGRQRSGHADLALRKSYDKQCNSRAGGYPAATNGAVIVMDPQTGAVYAMSSCPSLQPQRVGGRDLHGQLRRPPEQAKGNDQLLNLAIQGVYTPGSTFKLNTATAALQSGLWGTNRESTTTTPAPSPSPGASTRAPPAIFHNSEGDGGFGEVDITTAIAKSMTTTSTTWGLCSGRRERRYGETPIQDLADQYGLGELTGIDLPDESPARVDSPADRQQAAPEDPTGYPNTTWFAGDNIEMAFGQGARCITPIDQAMAYAAFANGGTRYAPQVASALVYPGGSVVEPYAPKVTGHVSLPPAELPGPAHRVRGRGQQQERHRLRRARTGGDLPRGRGRQDGHRRHGCRARSRPPGSWGGGRRLAPPSTWWCA